MTDSRKGGELDCPACGAIPGIDCESWCPEEHPERKPDNVEWQLIVGWQPMSTAPQDGRLLLLDLGKGFVDVGNWFKMPGDGFWVCHSVKVSPIAWHAIPPLLGWRP